MVQTLKKVFRWRSTALVEELTGAEHEAGPGKLHVLEAHLGLAQSWVHLGQNCDRLGWRRRMDVTEKQKKRTQKDKRDFVTFAF